VAPIEIVPSEVPPEPALITTFPPILLPPPAVALPAAKLKFPPVAPAPLVSSPAVIETFAPVPAAPVELPGLIAIAVAAEAAAVVISGFWPPAKVILPAAVTFKLVALTENVPVPLPIATFPEDEAKVVAPVEVKAVNEPAAADDWPMLVPLIVPPVMVTLLALKLLAVIFPPIVTVSSVEPRTIVSAVISLEPMLMEFPDVPVPMLIVLALLPVPTLTVPVVPESSVAVPVVPEIRLKLVVAPEVIEPTPAKPKAVAEVEIVSIDETPVSAPPVETFSPVEVKANVAVPLPIATFPDVVAKVVLPVEVSVVNEPAAAVV
jgi:hypothetical protein